MTTPPPLLIKDLSDSQRRPLSRSVPSHESRPPIRAPGIHSPLSKKDPHPAGDEFLSPPGIFSRPTPTEVSRPNASELLAASRRTPIFARVRVVRLLKHVGLRVAGVGVLAAPSASVSGGEPKTVLPQPPTFGADRPLAFDAKPAHSDRLRPRAQTPFYQSQFKPDRAFRFRHRNKV